MSTPPRLNQLECPNCHALTWLIASDCPGSHAGDFRHEQRPYPCSTCSHVGPGWMVRQQSPPEFLLQPHDLYPMTQEAFDYWVDILKTHFPTHHRLADVGTTFVPRLPEEAAALKAARDAAYPVGEMRDQDGACRVDPVLRDVIDWIEMMNDGDVLRLHRRDGGTLSWWRQGSLFSAECVDAAGALQAQASGIGIQAVHEMSREYLGGDVSMCINQLRTIGEQAGRARGRVLQTQVRLP